MMNMKEQRRYLGISTKALAEDTSTKKKITDYCIIDHMGALESEEVMKQAYALAYSLTEFPKMTYTMKKLIQAGVPYSVENISNKQRNMIRFNKHPKQAIVICSDLNTTVNWYIDIWAEKVDSLTVILCEAGHNPEIITLQELHPEWYVAHEAKDSIYRRCANIWANALGWSFSAPLYRDTVGGMNENFHVRPDFKQYKDDAGIAGHFSKISSKPSTFIKTTAVASEEECKAFFEHYKYLKQHNLLEKCLEPGYELCPKCGRPIRDTAEDCNYCTMHREVEINEFETYFDDTYEEDEM